jgi:hypothetical protein
MSINVIEYRRSYQKWTIQRNWQHRVHKTKEKQNKQKLNTIGVGHHLTQTKTNNINKTSALLQTTGLQDEPNICSERKPQQTSQYGTQNAKTHNRITQKI